MEKLKINDELFKMVSNQLNMDKVLGGAMISEIKCFLLSNEIAWMNLSATEMPFIGSNEINEWYQPNELLFDGEKITFSSSSDDKLKTDARTLAMGHLALIYMYFTKYDVLKNSITRTKEEQEILEYGWYCDLDICEEIISKASEFSIECSLLSWMEMPAEEWESENGKEKYYYDFGKWWKSLTKEQRKKLYDSVH